MVALVAPTCPSERRKEGGETKVSDRNRPSTENMPQTSQDQQGKEPAPPRHTKLNDDRRQHHRDTPPQYPTSERWSAPNRNNSQAACSPLSIKARPPTEEPYFTQREYMDDTE